MASESRARDVGDDVDDRGTGGKIGSPRRAFSTAGTSLYSRPVETASPFACRRQSRGWLSGIVSGAGKLISSVFRSDDDGSPCSSSESSESGLEGDSDNDVADGAGEDNTNGEDHENGEVQPSTNWQLIEDPRGDCQPLASISGSKLAIERLLQQETFTRDEGNRLIEIIGSRITDSPRIEDRWDTRLLEFPAIMEAKKWVEQKRSESASKTDISFRNCGLNTDLLHNDHECDKESPVNMAKSYMQSLPAWGSPLARSSGFKTAFELQESPFGSCSRPLLMPMKRDSLAVESQDALEQTRNVRQKTSEEFSRNFGPCDSVQDADLQTSITNERTPELQPQGSIKENSFSDPLCTADLLAKRVNFQADNGFCNETVGSFCKDAVSTAEEPLHAIGRDEPIVGALSTAEEPLHAIGRDEPIVGALTSKFRSPASDKANEQMELVVILPSKEQGCSAVPNETDILNYSCIENKGPVDKFSVAEPITKEPENVNLELPSPVQSSFLEKNGGAKSAQSGRFVDSEAATSSDRRSLEKIEERQKETISSATQFTSNGGSYPPSFSAESEKEDLSMHTLTLDSRKSIDTSNGDLGIEINVSEKGSPKATIGRKRKSVRTKGVHKVHNEITMREIKDILKEAPTTSTSPGNRRRRRGPAGSGEKKAVLRPRRSKTVKQ